MTALVAVPGLLALACTLQDVDPVLGTNIGAPHASSLVSRDGRGTLIGWLEVDGTVSVQNDENGDIVLRGKLADSEDETWAIVRPTAVDREFTMEWLMDGAIAKNGGKTAVVWSKGNCERLAVEGANS